MFFVDTVGIYCTTCLLGFRRKDNYVVGFRAIPLVEVVVVVACVSGGTMAEGHDALYPKSFRQKLHTGD